MTLPIQPPLQPQLARGRAALPTDGGWSFEPKLDGFRAIAFVDGDDVYLLSRGGKPLQRYFPEVTFPAGRYVLDGELIIDADSGAAESENFDALSQRIHPAASRIERLSIETPARYVAFDLLALDDDDLMQQPFVDRRAALEALFGVAAGSVTRSEDGPVTGSWAAGTSCSLTPAVRAPQAAEQWLTGRGEGVVAKLLDSPYLPGERKAMVKIKRQRTIDAVLAGYRTGKEAGTVGSLMLGLYGEDGELRVVGHTSGLKAKEKRELVETLRPYETGQSGSADPSRWRPDEELAWVALRPELVIEVSFDQVSAGRIRHGAKLLRWRDDKPPAECTIDQLDQ
ncbi:MAG: ATP-dependent DNA ligase [Solirubrobacteraceae bacterium]|nr:ATP-dependent DNA ligase [Solirubrobacteraceae bacterium]